MKTLTLSPKTSTLPATLLLTGLLLGACASTPPTPPPALVDARQAVANAAADPMVRLHAPLELKTANDSLGRANALLLKGDASSDLDSAAYVAAQQARSATAVAQAKSSDAAVLSSEAERERARADQRGRELERSRSQTGVAQRQAAAAEQVSERAVAVARDAQAELAALQAQKTERGMLVTLGDVLFELNRAEVKPAAQQSLRKLADFLQQYPQRQVLVEGHTDNSGGAALNDALSLRRADAVRAALLATHTGLDAARIATVGHGERFPVADNASASNRAMNRRVEIYISENEQPVRPRR